MSVSIHLVFVGECEDVVTILKNLGQLYCVGAAVPAERKEENTEASAQFGPTYSTPSL